MDRLLSLSQAARMVGVRRSTLQSLIQEGKLQTFEGSLPLSELLSVFPEADPDQSGMMEKMAHIKEGALQKIPVSTALYSERLASEVHRLRLDLQQARSEVVHYHALTEELKNRLYDMQAQCDKKQKIVLGALITWLVRRTHSRI